MGFQALFRRFFLGRLVVMGVFNFHRLIFVHKGKNIHFEAAHEVVSPRLISEDREAYCFSKVCAHETSCVCQTKLLFL